MKKYFKYVVLLVILLIPFIYSFFYLKAYWNPYGKGNIDNIPVAVVNDDDGDKGEKLVKSIKKSGKLKIKVVPKEGANDGLYEGKYYAVINIPSSFTKDLESASSIEKTHATITYSPNQKANFLASQIINSVVNAVEKNLDNEVNSTIVSKLSDTVKKMPDKLDKVSDGFSKLKEGTNQLFNGSSSLASGTHKLSGKYQEVNSGILDLNEGTKKINDGSEKLKNGLKSASDGSKQIKTVLDSKIEELKNDNSDALTDEQINMVSINATQNIINNEDYIKEIALNQIKQNDIYISISDGINKIETYYINNGIKEKEQCNVLEQQEQIIICQESLEKYPTLKEEKTIMEEVAKQAAYSSALSVAQTTSKETAKQVSNLVKNRAKESSITSLTELSNNISMLNNGLDELYSGSLELSTGTHSLFDGTNTLSNGSAQINYALKTLDMGANTLNGGISTLNSSISSAKDKLDSNIENTKKEVKKVESLSEYSKNPVKVKTKEVNKVNSYGIAFTPFFISIGLWVGSLMMFIVLYYDKKERFGVYGENEDNKVKQILSYHGLISLSAIILGALLHILLAYHVENVPLYYISLLLIGNTFMGIIEFLIITFKDLGKFISLILLVLQLAASGGTFPIETVTKSFRWMNNLLPMTYTVNLLKEVIIKIDNNLLSNNIIIISVICVFFMLLNILIAKLRQNKIDS